MKAMVYTEYGAPEEVLRLEEIEKPTPKAGEVLVQVRAAAVNFGDWALVRGDPFLIRLMTGGLSKPKSHILGADIAGIVEVVGPGVTDFKPGDEVFGDVSDVGFGGFAEYVATQADHLVNKPANLTFEEAAAVPQAAVVALQGLVDEGHIEPGEKVLVNGASGGVGTFAVQLAKNFGAEVTGVCSTRNLDLVRSLGADYVIDYTKEDFVQTGSGYDLILATAGYRSIFDYRRALKPDGTYVMTGGAMAQVFQAMFLGSLLSMVNDKQLTNLAATTDREDLILVKELIEAGKVKPVIDSCYPLGDVAEALSHYGGGHSRGKVIITMPAM